MPMTKTYSNGWGPLRSAPSHPDGRALPRGAALTTDRPTAQRGGGGVLFGLGAALLFASGQALAVPELAIVPGATSFAHNAGGGTADLILEVQLTGLDADTALAAYDFGIAYDPTVLRLSGFSGFTDRLGDPAEFEVFNQDHLGDVNSLWDYRADHPDLGAYTGPRPGTPDITPQFQINEGSLRFSQASILERDALLTLQDHNVALVLIRLEFAVATTGYRTGTPVILIDDRHYAGFPGTSGLLDLKLSTADDPNGDSGRFLPVTNAWVEVPVAPPMVLLLPGLGLALAGRRGPPRHSR